MSFDGLGRFVLALLIGRAVSWACLIALIAGSVAFPASLIAPAALGGWLLIAASWLAVQATSGKTPVTGPRVLWIVSSWPVDAVIAIVGKESRPWD